MPKISPNKVSVDPKAYAARITRAKKIVAAIDPATKAKLKEMYPDIKKEAIVNKALNPKKATAKKPVAPRTPSKGVKTQMPKTTKAPAKKTPMPKVTKKPTTPSMPRGEKPAVGADKAAKKKYGKDSWNNGYTN
ncbi:MAG: hypothetical protein EBU08_18420 [Micrococcales bacterium]|nr:hypothetical protein [Micrococcales bacterium]